MSEAKDSEAKEESRSRIDEFESQIKELAKAIGFDPTVIIEAFRSDGIRSTAFSLDAKFKFIVEHCEKKWQILVSKGKLKKFYEAMTAKYRIDGPCIATENNQIYTSEPLVFIANKCTQEIITNQLLHSSQLKAFNTTKRLAQYLNKTIRLSKTNKYINCYRSNNDIEFLVINSELHDKNGNIWYIFCIRNDMISQNTEKFKYQMVKLVTAEEFIQLFGGPVQKCITSQLLSLFKTHEAFNDTNINRWKTQIAEYIEDDSIDGGVLLTTKRKEFGQSLVDLYGTKIRGAANKTHDRFSALNISMGHEILPKGSREHGLQFRQQSITKTDIERKCNNIKIAQFKMIQTASDRKAKKRGDKYIEKVPLSEWKSCIIDAVKSKDPKHHLFPIVSMMSGKRFKGRNGNYNIDQALPIKIRDHWAVICYRDGLSFPVLFDPYDIINKAILYSPTFDANSLSFLSNKICSIEITPDQSPITNKPQQSLERSPIIMEECKDKPDSDNGFRYPPYYNESSPQTKEINETKTDGQKSYHYSSVVSFVNENNNDDIEGDIENNTNTSKLAPILDGTAANTIAQQPTSVVTPNTNSHNIIQHPLSSTNNQLLEVNHRLIQNKDAAISEQEKTIIVLKQSNQALLSLAINAIQDALNPNISHSKLQILSSQLAILQSINQQNQTQLPAPTNMNMNMINSNQQIGQNQTYFAPIS